MNSLALRTAVLGCGRMGLATLPSVRRHLPNCWLPLSHAEAVVSHPSFQLVGLCDPILDQREKAKALYPDVPFYAEPEQLLHEVRPDVVCIATRTPERTALIELCIAYGIRRLHIEKPLCTSVEELRTLSSRLRASGAHCTFGTLRRYLAPYRKAYALLRDLRIGHLQEVQVALGPGRLCWSQIHGIDLIETFLSDLEITEVRAIAVPDSYAARGLYLDGDPLLRYALISTAEGPQGVISTAGGCDAWLYGDCGMIGVLNDGQQLIMRCSNSAGDPYWEDQLLPEVPAAAHSGTAAALDRLVSRDQGVAVADTEAILRSQALLFAAAQSILMRGVPVDPGNLESDLVVTGRSGSLYA